MNVQDRISQILWDRRIISVPTDISSPIPELILFYPTISDRNLASHLHTKILNDAIKQGVPTEKDIVETAIATDYWSQHEEDFMQQVDIEITNLRKTLREQTLIAKKRRLEKDIEAIQDKQKELKNRRDIFVINSAEYLANRDYILFLVKRLSADFDGNLLWHSESDFYRDLDKFPAFMSFIAGEIIHEGMISIQKIREVARSFDWRMIWSLNRESLDALFDRKISDLTQNQKMLIYWSRVYDNVYEDPNRPDEDIIEDDEKLDAWMINKSENDKENREPNKSSKLNEHQERAYNLDGYYVDECVCGAMDIKVKGHGERPRHTDTCLWGTYVKYTPEEKLELADRIYGRNSRSVRSLINNELESVSERGIVQEQHLRGKKSRKILQSNEQVHRK